MRFYKNITMVLEIVKTVSARVKTATDSFKAQFPALIRRLYRVFSEHVIQKNSIASQAGCALNVGRRFRLTRSHALNFSLFTYFGDRQ